MLPVTGELFVPHVQLPSDVHRRRCTERRVSLLQHVSVPLQHFQVAWFHVKQRPIEKPTPVFAPLKECLESFRCDDHDGKSSSQRRDRSHFLAIDPKASPTYALFNTNRTTLIGLVTADLAENRERLGLVPDDRSGSPCTKGTSEAENMDRLEKARLAAAVWADQQIDARSGSTETSDNERTSLMRTSAIRISCLPPSIRRSRLLPLRATPKHPSPCTAAARLHGARGLPGPTAASASRRIGRFHHHPWGSGGNYYPDHSGGTTPHPTAIPPARQSDNLR